MVTALRAHKPRSGSQAEHQQRLRLLFRQQLPQFAIDRLIGNREDVSRQFDIVESRATQPQQPRHQRLRRIKGRTGKSSEAGNEDAQLIFHFTPVSPRSAPQLPPG
jgi:hypothetical protein